MSREQILERKIIALGGVLDEVRGELAKLKSETVRPASRKPQKNQEKLIQEIESFYTKRRISKLQKNQRS